MALDSRGADEESQIRGELGEVRSPAGQQLNVPDWVTETARNYRHRGLPLVDLWQSSHCMVALGLSNHGVPGVYFSQKLP
jgi:hypothetical protein